MVFSSCREKSAGKEVKDEMVNNLISLVVNYYSVSLSTGTKY